MVRSFQQLLTTTKSGTHPKDREIFKMWNAPGPVAHHLSQQCSCDIKVIG